MTHRHKNIGFSLIEVMVTIVILMVGLLGLAALQGRALTSQLESYQRSQALILVRDIENRINANRKNAANYVTLTPLGAGSACPIAANPTVIVDKDKEEWCNALMGAAEVQSGVPSAGAMIGARGCVYQILSPATGIAAEYRAVVAWQGLNNTKAPDVTTATSAGQCGVGQYGNESLHRVVTLPISIADLN
ncbi:MAG: type IV pilus modification protein PilV [Pseudomonadota bacterium]|nr:type IV pilus modification protein PilV [Pseudomonadota bacterium]